MEPIPTMFDGVTWGVTVSELITEAISFISIFKEFILLGAVLILAPYLVSFFKSVVRKRQRAAE